FPDDREIPVGRHADDGKTLWDPWIPWKDRNGKDGKRVPARIPQRVEEPRVYAEAIESGAGPHDDEVPRGVHGDGGRKLLKVVGRVDLKLHALAHAGRVEALGEDMSMAGTIYPWEAAHWIRGQIRREGAPGDHEAAGWVHSDR